MNNYAMEAQDPEDWLNILLLTRMPHSTYTIDNSHQVSTPSPKDPFVLFSLASFELVRRSHQVSHVGVDCHVEHRDRPEFYQYTIRCPAPRSDSAVERTMSVWPAGPVSFFLNAGD